MPRSTFALCRAGLAALLLGALSAHAAAPGAHGAAPGAMPYPNTDGFGMHFDSGEDWHRQCMRVAHLAPSRTYAATPTAEGQHTKATDLYYLKRDQTSTTAAKWSRVREQAQALGDDAVLMMLYANGYGVARDTDRAIYHACRLDAAKAEMEARVDYLASGSVASDRQPFDLCDHITSGRMGGVCAAIGEGRDDRTRRARLDRFAAKLPAAARQPFARLRKAADAFAQKSADEVDMTGSGGAGFAYRHTGRRDKEFMETLFKAAGGKLARASAAQLERLERELNAQYSAVLATPSENENHPGRIHYLTVTREDVRTTERAWLAYRDAWAAYLAAARMPTDLVSVQAELTRQRIAQLRKLSR
ncbi:lysozyme inhibitor LprI family protein [Massilia niabensis]|uniref:Lysozyme inhibitor LprI family protein n=1 Tax=Massilia niabensis TaxID=544910 RepID=A0ABW0L6R1_9BURK